MTAPTWPKVRVHVGSCVRSALRDHPRISRRLLLEWARGVARSKAEITRLSPEKGKQINRIVDALIAASS